jgi:SpoIIAA-like
MIELIQGLPEGVVGIEAVGKVTSDDYAAVTPAIGVALASRDKIRLIHVLGARFSGYTAGGIWEDGKLALSHPLSFERIAVVTDHGGVRAPREGRGLVGSRGDAAVLQRRARRGGHVGERRPRGQGRDGGLVGQGWPVTRREEQRR